MQFRAIHSMLIAMLAFGLAGCEWLGSDAAEPRARGAATADPVIARALNDPLMSDPDLARRSEANALLSYADSSALPVLEATADTSRQAREAARNELLKGGAIGALPQAMPGSGGKNLGKLVEVSAILAASGAPSVCGPAVREGFDWAVRLAAPAAIMPLGMVEHAAGAEAPGCRLRLVRYLTPASIEDALTYHHALASRAGFEVRRYAEPEAILRATGKNGEDLRVHVRPALGGMNAVDLVYRFR
jgi:hypothetical protein